MHMCIDFSLYKQPQALTSIRTTNISYSVVLLCLCSKVFKGNQWRKNALLIGTGN